MNDAAQVSPGMITPTPELDPPVLCYQGKASLCHTPTPTATATIAFQEKSGVSSLSGGCANLTGLLSTASADNSLFMEVYPTDINTCF